MDAIAHSPYSPPNTDLTSGYRPSGWRFVPAVISMIGGLPAVMMAMVCVVIAAKIIADGGALSVSFVGGVAFISSLYLVFGVSWVVAGVLYCRSRYRQH